MKSTLSAATTSSKRRSCDRCHGQKLRCIRSDNSDTEVCNRCLRQGAQCVYSSSLPKGRPNLYPSTDPAAILPIPTSVTIAPMDGRHGSRSGASGDMNEEALLAGLMDSPPFTNTDMPLDLIAWPVREPLAWNNQMPLDEVDQGPSRWPTESSPTINRQNYSSAAILNTPPSSAGYSSIQNGNDIFGQQTLPSSPSQLQGDGDRLREKISKPNSNRLSEKESPDAGIARLSQLSTYLYPLYRSCCTLADAAGSSSAQSRDTCGAQHHPLIDDTAFKSVTAWLGHVSTNMESLSQTKHPELASQTSTGNILHGAFSASYHLLEILRCEQADTASNVSSPPPNPSTCASSSASGSHVDSRTSISHESDRSPFTTDGGGIYFERRKCSSSFARSSSEYSNAAVRHLVIACHTLLLNVYVAVLIALQYDVDQWSACHPAGSDDTSDCKERMALADIRLVMAVQLCSYLFERQHRAVDSFLSTASNSANREVVDDLKMEVEQRLARLRQGLRIQI